MIAWWIFYRWRDQQPWTFYLFLFVLISPTILYLASLLPFPRESDVDTAIDYKAHHYANHRAFFILFGLHQSIADSLLKGVPHFLLSACIFHQQFALFRRLDHCCDHAKRAVS